MHSDFAYAACQAACQLAGRQQLHNLLTGLHEVLFSKVWITYVQPIPICLLCATTSRPRQRVHGKQRVRGGEHDDGQNEARTWHAGG